MGPSVYNLNFYWVGHWDTKVFYLIGFIRTLYTNIFQRAPKANQVDLGKGLGFRV